MTAGGKKEERGSTIGGRRAHAYDMERDATRNEKDEEGPKRGVLFACRRETWKYFEDYVLSLEEASKLSGRPFRILWWEFGDGSDSGAVERAVRVPGGPHCVFVQRLPPEVATSWRADGPAGSGVLAVLNTEQCTRGWVLDNMVAHVLRGWTLLDFAQANLDLVRCAVVRRRGRETDPSSSPARLLWLPYQLASSPTSRGVGASSPPSTRLEERERDTAQVCVESRRRIEAQEALKRAGLSVMDVRGWREERERQIDRAKVLVNVHNDEVEFRIFEHVRCDQVIYRGGLIVSEESLGQDALDVRDRVVFCPYEQISSTARDVVDHLDRYREMCYGGWDRERWAEDRLEVYRRAVSAMDAWTTR